MEMKVNNNIIQPHVHDKYICRMYSWEFWRDKILPKYFSYWNVPLS